MDNGTLKALETERKTTDSLELYRFVFLRYLEAASDLIELKEEAAYVDCMKKVVEDGWSFTDRDFAEKEELSVLGGKILYYRYGIDYSRDSIENAIIQFRAEMEAAELQEKLLWESLVTSVQNADANNDCPEWGIAWYDMDAVEQHRLILDDDLALERVSHYIAELQKTDKIPLPPYSQEVSFGLHCHGLGTVASFSLRW
ncbi:MAG: hypothetical protein Q4F56_01230 [Candidatus Saccharibacteria bacterium]|nr:hypothetical protein [Candidatus Saccharibacteria bacterium]